jgi:uncharacterized membrane protein YgcG
MLVIAIVVLTLILLVLISKPAPKGTEDTRRKQPPAKDAKGDADGSASATTKNEFTPGGGDFGGAGSSGSWGADGDGDGGGD